MYKYISKNILFVATVAPKASGEIGSATPEEAWLYAYLIDTVSGRILHRVSHQGAQGPIHAVRWHFFSVSLFSTMHLHIQVLILSISLDNNIMHTLGFSLEGRE